MALRTATMAALDRAAKARDDEVEPRQQIADLAGDAYSSLSGWRAVGAAAVFAGAVVLVGIPVLAAVDPAMFARASGAIQVLAGLNPLLLAGRAVVLVVALVVISRPHGRP